jgi:hypothetical protein
MNFYVLGHRSAIIRGSAYHELYFIALDWARLLINILKVRKCNVRVTYICTYSIAAKRAELFLAVLCFY